MKKVARGTYCFGGVLLFSVLILLLTHFIISRWQMKQESVYAGNILAHSETVYQQVLQTIARMQPLSSRQCDDVILEKMRAETWRGSFIEDIGFLQGNTLICSATWGKMASGIALPAASVPLKNNVFFIAGEAISLPEGVTGNAVVEGNVVVFIPPSSHNQYRYDNSGYSAEVITRNGRHVLTAILREDRPSRLLSGHVISPITVEQCSFRYPFCVVVRSYRPGLMIVSSGGLSVAILLSLIIGGGVVYSMVILLQHFRSLEFRLERAIRTGKLYLEYQPVIQLRHSRIVGAEALVRWQDSLFGRVSPELFIDLAERMHLLKPLTEFVISTALKAVSPILHSGKPFCLSINLSGREMLTEAMIDYLDKQRELNRVQASQIKIEITEKNNLYYRDIAVFAAELKRRGYRISLDDFGTGTANLVWLREIPFDEVKIDKVFISHIDEEYKRDIFMAILNVVSAPGKEVVVEGVESRSELAFVREHAPGALVQGWYYYKSLPADVLRAHFDAQFSGKDITGTPGP
ncbi:EAL domain-containing protein [Enterobacter quasiroggenkampii]|uniref:EAL domain-containing protein n=1 Tax=Enterobacter quasiroggenkampii TaxID=2497436 RepID=UPI0021D0DD8C|nr:EAL domain-containing protein [Enterobacter quasiroggenkampii]MCU6388834.1 EAL domain-containing protein [Enterobacter quasiroggenkampii]